ncbi:9600_t:CDS:1 [Ambispora gerdemannii]|uniref:Origin recognition complex subunit 2 n=1 Tax=Ambispora gerdemannii TaxID=144530 RepID=A0A9N8UW61_9GLOM|nr:9600_t:CDS:1 [Ambispora gerdemannii]
MSIQSKTIPQPIKEIQVPLHEVQVVVEPVERKQVYKHTNTRKMRNSPTPTIRRSARKAQEKENINSSSSNNIIYSTPDNPFDVNKENGTDDENTWNFRSGKKRRVVGNFERQLRNVLKEATESKQEATAYLRSKYIKSSPVKDSFQVPDESNGETEEEVDELQDTVLGENADDESDEKEEQKIQVIETKRTRRVAAVHERDEKGWERYFADHHSTSSARTSFHTLSKLPAFEQKDLIETINSLPLKHQDQLGTIAKNYEALFSQWYYQLRCGFNIICYGYGSKRGILEKFARARDDIHVLIINGFMPKTTLKTVLRDIIQGYLNEQPHGSMEQQTKHIVTYFSILNREINKLYLVFHNIDAVQLRTEQTYNCLSIIASCPNIRLIASTDHINIGMLFDQVTTSRFNWLWFELATFQPHKIEHSFQNSSLMNSESELSPQAVYHVLSSLSQRARGVFKTLIEHQIAEAEKASKHLKPKDTGIEYNALYDKCRREFHVNSDNTFRGHLTEFRDHRIIQSYRSAHGTDILYVPLDPDRLKGIAEKLEELGED